MNFYIPVEIRNRELDAKLYLGHLAAKEGIVSIVGRRQDLYRLQHTLPPGVILEKGLEPPKKSRCIRVYRKNGHSPLALDEEGMFLDREKYVETRIMKEGFCKLDLFFAWGEYQKGILAEAFPEQLDKIKIVGNSRLDLLRKELRYLYKEDIEAIDKQYGKVILINSTFTLAAPANGEKLKEKYQLSGFYDDVEIKQWIEEKTQSTIANRDHFRDLAIHLAGILPDYTIIIRPHPSEDSTFWRNETDDIRNIVVTNNGSVVPWLLQADVMIHSSCTTAIESILLDKISVSYDPTHVQEYQTDLPRKVSLLASTQEEVLEHVQWLLNNKQKMSYDARVDALKVGLAPYIPLNSTKSASRVMVEELKKLQNGKGLASNKIDSLKKIRAAAKMFSFKNTIKKYFIKRRYFDASAYNKHKFPDMELAEIRTFIDRLNGKSEVPVSVEELRKNVYLLYTPS